MGDGDDRALVVLQEAFEPGDRLGVEVVGRLVEQQQVGALQQEPAQRDAAPLAAGEVGDGRVARRQPQRVHRDLERAFDVPAVRGVDLVLELALLLEQRVEVGVGVAHRRAHVVELGEQRHDLADAVGHVAGDVLVGSSSGSCLRKPTREARA